MLHILEARGNANHGASYALQYRVRPSVLGLGLQSMLYLGLTLGVFYH